MTETRTPPSLRLTEACWPVFEFITNFVRQVKFGSTPPAEQVRFEGLSALRDAEDLARDDPKAERLWIEKAKAMVVYFVDYKMINTEWDGRNFWFDKPFEIDPQILDHAQALGGRQASAIPPPTMASPAIVSRERGSVPTRSAAAMTMSATAGQAAHLPRMAAPMALWPTK